MCNICESLASEISLTGLLQAWQRGHPQASERVFAAVMPELRRLARQRLRRMSAAISWQATDLVQEGYLRLAAQGRITWQCRDQFFALASTIFRRILLDHAKHRRRLKRGQDAIRVTLDDSLLLAEARRPEMLDLDRALTELAQIQVSASRVVEMRVFGGLGLDETAACLGLSRKTVQRRWRFARVWLATRLGKLV